MIRIVNFLLHTDMIIVHYSTRLYEHVWVPLCVHPAALFFPSLPPSLLLEKKKKGSLRVMKAFGPLISGHRRFADSYWKQKKSIRKAESPELRKARLCGSNGKYVPREDEAGKEMCFVKNNIN